MNRLPLYGIKIIDFSQFLSGPMATQKLADMGAEVIKIERKGVGDICRTLYLSRQEINGESTLFHAINRNKNSLEIDLKNPDDHALVMQLIAESDVLIQNFRPGVIAKYQLDFDSLKTLFPRLVYGSVSGYGSNPDSNYYHIPGQDLLAQSLSGMANELSNNTQPQGIALADMMAGNHLVEGVLAALIQRAITGTGTHIEVSLLESLMDTMMTSFTQYLNAGVFGEASIPEPTILTIDLDHYLFAITSEILALFVENNRHLLTSDSSNNRLVAVPTEQNPNIKSQLLFALDELAVDYHLIQSWDFLLSQKQEYKEYLTQTVTLQDNQSLLSTRLPIRFNGEIIRSNKPAPQIGEHNEMYHLANQSKLINKTR